MISVLPKLVHDPYEKLLYKSLFLLSYYCCLRAGEAVYSNSTSHTLQFNQIKAYLISNVKVISTEFASYKHSKSTPPRFIMHPIRGSEYCPVNTISQYAGLRGDAPGPLFVDKAFIPLTRQKYSSMIKSCLFAFGLETILTHFA
jgi:hypothetical protein